MSNIKPFNQKVIEHNDLILATARMPKTSLLAFEYIISTIDPDNIPDDLYISVSKKRMMEFFRTEGDHKRNKHLHDSIIKLQKDAIFIMDRELVKLVNGRERKVIDKQSIVPFVTIHWDNISDTIDIRLNPDIVQYIAALRSNFTQYPIKDIMEFKSKYAIVLYRWLLMNYNLYENYQHNGKRSKKNLEEYKNPSIEIERLRQITDTVEEYERMADFTKRVLDTAIDEINEKTKYHVTYDKIKQKKRIVRIQFNLDKPIDYIDESTLESNDAQSFTGDIALTYLDAMRSPYTQYLIEAQLINQEEATDSHLMVQLFNTLYPIYDEIEEIKGINGIRMHLKYVKSNMKNSQNANNIAKYLIIAATQRLGQLKVEVIQQTQQQKEKQNQTKKHQPRTEPIPEWLTDYKKEQSENERIRKQTNETIISSLTNEQLEYRRLITKQLTNSFTDEDEEIYQKLANTLSEEEKKNALRV